MSTAYKHLYSCVTFLIFIFVFNFYKNRLTVSRDRDVSFRAASKLKRAGALNRPLPLDEAGDDFFFGFPSSSDQFVANAEDEDDEEEPYDGARWRHWDRLKQYPGRCLDVEVFFIPPASSRGGPERTNDRDGRLLRRSGPDREGLHYKTLQGARRKEQLDGASDETNSSVYVFLSVLVILLLAAGVDIAKHLTGARPPQDQETQRRLSLQNYQALIREKQKQFRMMKQHYSQPSMSIHRSTEEPPGYPSLPFGIGRFGEDTCTAPTAKGLPVPLLRRQSVPTLMRSQAGFGPAMPAAVAGAPAGGRNVGPSPFGRRTSVDSFWDTELHLAKGGAVSSCAGLASGSSPEVRRRVRMLHRH